MVYQIFDDGIDETTKSRRRQLGVKQTSTTATRGIAPINLTDGINTGGLDYYVTTLLILLMKIFLLIYDAITLPIYFVLQRPDRQARQAQQTRSQQVDVNTWIRISQVPYEIQGNCDSNNDKGKSGRHKYLGATISEIFAQAVCNYDTLPCLGYRAVITCPVIGTSRAGKSILQDKSFRSDYTWYTYGQVGHRVQDIASGLYKHSVYPGDRSLFMASTCLEWFCMAQACFQLNIQLVLPAEVNDPMTTLALILRESQARVLFVTCDQLEKLCGLLFHLFGHSDTNHQENEAKLKLIVLIDWQFSVDFNETIFANLGQTLKLCSSSQQIEILSIGQIEEAGIEHPVELRCSQSLAEENRAWPTQAGARSSIQRDFEPFDCLQFCSSAPLTRRWLKSVDATFSESSQCLEPSPSTWHHLNLSTKTTKANPGDLAMIVYTYGALGQLKPIMVSHEQLARSSNQLFLDGMISASDVHCTILSLTSMIELMTELCVFSRGGRIGYSCNMHTFFYDGQQLFARDKSDLGALEPTYLLLKPYILERLRVSIQNYQQSRLNSIMGFIHKYVLYDYKKYWARWHFGTPIVDRLFCSRLGKLFGSRIKFILCNGATDCTETKDFFAFMLGLPVIELYGPNEALVSMMSVNDIWDYKRRTTPGGNKVRQQEKSGYGWRLFQFDVSGHLDVDSRQDETDEDQDLVDYQNIQLMPPTVNRNSYRQNLSRNLLFVSSVLCPTNGTRIRLEDWEEFNVCDRPYPRGRLLIGGDPVSRGYFGRPTLTRDSIFKDSNTIWWFRTDDIARVFPNGSFEIISAISDMIKMVDGQFVSLSQIEHILRNSQFVDNVCAVCGDDRTLVINLVMPNLRRLALKSPGEANLKTSICIQPEPEELIDVEFRREVCNDRLLCEFISDHLSELIARAGLASIVNKFLLVPEIWTHESELVTSAFKPKRAAIQKFYANDIRSIISLGLGESNSGRLLARRQRVADKLKHRGASLSHNFRLDSYDSTSSLNNI